MSDFFAEAREFIHTLSEEDNMPNIEIARYCGISWQVVNAILNVPNYDMGTVNYRKILAKKISYLKVKAAREKAQIDNAILESLSGDGYKEGRTVQGGNRKRVWGHV